MASESFIHALLLFVGQISQNFPLGRKKLEIPTLVKRCGFVGTLLVFY